MELQLLIFIGLIVAVLAGNATLLWVLYRGLSACLPKAKQLDRSISRLSNPVRKKIVLIEAVSARATKMSAKARQHANSFTNGVDEFQTWFRSSQEKIDSEMDRFSAAFQKGTDKFTCSIKKPLLKTGVIVQSIRAVLQFATIIRRHDPSR